ncbi:MAG TPA: triose-phosphate isomerase [Nitrososphaerales archaeon]|nr:triose-phosphate isomerase [Nitrososphaerales archaeon]
MRTLIVNFKNYPEILGEGSVRLAEAVQRVAGQFHVEAIVAPPIPMLSLVAWRVKVPVYSQTVSSESGEKTTGAILIESVRAAGASGTILNHSESTMPILDLRRLVPKLDAAGMDVCLCARTTKEAVRLTSLGTKYLAIEPPQLIGSGIAVSKAKPGLIRDTVTEVRKAGYKGRVLCGAGIVSGEDVERSIELGAEGVLVASGVVKSGDWESKLRELAHPLS